MKKLFDKIFGRKLGKGALIVSILGFIIGMTLVLIATEVYIKTDKILNSKQTTSVLIVNKRVSLLANTLLNAKTSFSSDELEKLNEQSFIRSASPILSSNYSNTVIVDYLGARFRTDAFFESIATEYLDILPGDFKWKEGDEIVPVIIPRDYVHLYNFGFAQSQNLPQIPASMLKKLKFNIVIKDINGEKHTYFGKLVGFSDRIPTILVPERFNQYANEKYGNPDERGITSRVLLEVNNPSNPDLKDFLKEKNYQTNNDKLNTGKAALIVSIVMLILLIFGLFFLTLSIVNIILFFSLLISEAKNEVKLLLELGYTSNKIAFYFVRYLIILVAIEVSFTMGIFITFNSFFNAYLSNHLGYELDTFVHTIPFLLTTFLVAIKIIIFWLDLNKILKRY